MHALQEVDFYVTQELQAGEQAWHFPRFSKNPSLHLHYLVFVSKYEFSWQERHSLACGPEQEKHD